MPILEVEHICKSFEGTEVLKDISFSLEKSQVLSIIGSSGSGKTTLLRCLNFLERPDGGIIKVNGETLFDAAQKSSTQEAEIRKKRLHFGLVFQSFNLFPQYTVIENIMLAPKLAAKEQIKQIAVAGAKLLKELAKDVKGNIRFEYSPESFHGTEVEYAVEVCNAVLDVWQPKADAKAIINIPTTVENAMPHVFATQVEYINKHLKYRDAVTLCLHPHNDRGCGVATAELGILAGAERIEGTLFGNGERTGNVDIVTLGMNMYSQGVDPKLDFSDMPHICEIYEECTGMKVGERSPYSGALVFAAFSGSHQDAIAKGMHWRDDKDPDHWNVPYLPIDPTDVGRNYDADVIRINSQSGKGGVGYILETKFGLNLPPKMREAMGYATKAVSDHKHKELHPDEIFNLFKQTFENITEPYSINEVHFQQKDGGIVTKVTSTFRGKTITTEASGNGRLDAVSNALKKAYELKYSLETYQEHALERSSSSKAIAYVGIKKPDGTLAWGAGVDADIIRASIDALVTAINNR